MSDYTEFGNKLEETYEIYERNRRVVEDLHLGDSVEDVVDEYEISEFRVKKLRDQYDDVQGEVLYRIHRLETFIRLYRLKFLHKDIASIFEISKPFVSNELRFCHIHSGHKGEVTEKEKGLTKDKTKEFVEENKEKKDFEDRLFSYLRIKADVEEKIIEQREKVHSL